MDVATPIYRYYDLNGFLYMMAHRVVRFSQIIDWPDKYEGESYRIITQAKGYSGLPCECFWGSCWTQEIDISGCYDDVKLLQLANDEIQKYGSAGMWGSYCERGGVRVKTNIRKLRHAIQTVIWDAQLVDGPVEYVPHVIAAPNDASLRMLFHKRTSFRYESEYRFIVVDKPRGLKQLEVPIGNPFEFFDEMLVSPTTQHNAWITDIIYQAIAASTSLGGNFKGGKHFVRKSQLYDHTSEEISHSFMRLLTADEAFKDHERLKRTLPSK